MSSRTRWQEIRPNLGLTADQRIKREKEEVLLEMGIRELQEHISDFTHSEVGRLLEVSQAAVWQLERRQDVAVNGIARFISRLGGQLELVASFTDRQIRVTQFDNIRGQILEKAQDRVLPHRRYPSRH
jgi:hypothetical protein